MRINLYAASNTNLVEAKRWLTNKSYWPAIAQIEEWVTKNEDDYGQCQVFIETSVPMPRRGELRHNQLDLVLCFDRFLIVCELKQHLRLRNIDIPRLYEQVSGQLKLVHRLYGENTGCPDPKFIGSLLFCPSLPKDDVDDLRRALQDRHSAHHIQCAGGYGQIVPALSSAVPPPHSWAKDANLSSLLQEMTDGFLISFGSFKQAIDYLNAMSAGIPFPSCYVPNSDLREQEDASKCLADHHFLEVVGPAGIGKSVFIMALLDKLGRSDFIEHELSKCSDLAKLYQQVMRKAEGLSRVQYQGDESLAALDAQGMVHWIRSYDEQSLRGMRELKAWLDSKSSEGILSYWILESKVPRLFQTSRVEIGGLSSHDLAEIVSKIGPGGAYSDPEVVIVKSQGNPRRAIALWQAESAYEFQDDGGDFAWLLGCASGPCMERLLPGLCQLCRCSPFGVSKRMVSRLADQIIRDVPPSSRSAAVHDVFDLIASHQLGVVTKFDAGILGRQIVDGEADYDSATMVHGLSEKFVEWVLSRQHNEEQLQESVAWALMEATCDTRDLPAVVYDLSQGKVETFMRSSFRRNCLHLLLSWLDSRHWQPASEKQDYLVQALRALGSADIEPDQSLSVYSSNSRDPDVLYARGILDLMRLRQQSPEMLDSVALEAVDPDLEAESAVALAVFLEKGNQAQKAWEVLLDARERSMGDCGSHVIVTMHMLAFLNRTKSAGIGQDQALSMIREFATEVISYGLLQQNVKLMSDALFFYVRSQELAGANRLTLDDTTRYLAAMNYLESLPTGLGRRLQLLLTHGSIYRHFCRKSDLEWDEFEVHRSIGFSIYQRVVKSSFAQSNIRHLLNAISYMGDFCYKGLRYSAGDQDGSRLELNLDYCHRTLSAFELLPTTDSLMLNDQDRRILDTCRRNASILHALVCANSADFSCSEAFLGTMNEIRRHQNPKIRPLYGKIWKWMSCYPQRYGVVLGQLSSHAR